MSNPRKQLVLFSGIALISLTFMGCATEPNGGPATSTGGTTKATGGSVVATGGAAKGTGGARTGGVTATGGAAATGGATSSIVLGNWLKCAVLDEGKMAYEYGAWKDKYLVDCGADKARVDFMEKAGVHTNNTVSEGIGYGILIAAGMRDCATVKRIYKFYIDAVNFTSASQNGGLRTGLMPWKFTNGCTTTTAADANFASDGDLDVAMGMLQADAVCPDAASYGYKAKAVQVINALKSQAFTNVNGKSAIKGGAVNNRINPSYFSPGYYRAFAKAVPGDASFWNTAATDALALLATYQNNGQWPDWTDAGGSSYDAIRVPWRLATDYAWSPTPAAKTLLDNYRSQAMKNQLPYASVINDNHNSAFVGANALSAMSADQAKMDAFCDDWLSRAIGFGITTGQLDDSPYYQGTLRVVYMMLASGYALSTL